MAASYIYQIYYDEASRAALDPGFLPLDNTANLRPDWYEFHVIKKFLENNHLEPGVPRAGGHSGGGLSPLLCTRLAAGAKQAV